MAYNSFKRHIWLVNLIYKNEGLKLKEIGEEWKKDLLISGGKELSRKNFCNYRDAIREYFDLDIYCEKQKYYVRETSPRSKDMLLLMEKLAFDNVWEEFANLKGRIIYELDLRPAKGRFEEDKKLRIVADAMSQSKKLEINYKPFGKEAKVRIVHPYCVKMYQQRMYLVGRSEEHAEIRTFCMDDRMISAKILDMSFTLPRDFDAQEYFSTALGVVPQTKEIPPQEIVLRATPTVAGYLKSVKLHPSQQIVEEADNHTDFSYRLAPTTDFKEEIIRRRGNLQVLEPIELVDDILKILDSTKRKLEEGKRIAMERYYNLYNNYNSLIIEE